MLASLSPHMLPLLDEVLKVVARVFAILHDVAQGVEAGVVYRIGPLKRYNNNPQTKQKIKLIRAVLIFSLGATKMETPISSPRLQRTHRGTSEFSNVCTICAAHAHSTANKQD